MIDGTSRAGIEAMLVSSIRPGDKVLVPVMGRFGDLLCEIARRCRAEVHTISVPWGEVFDPQMVEDAIIKIRPRLLLTVQGDTSTTMLQPLAELGEICRRHDVLFYTDATASFGGNPMEVDARITSYNVCYTKLLRPYLFSRETKVSFYLKAITIPICS